MGREIAEAVPEAMEVYRDRLARRRASTSSSSASTTPLEELVETEVQQPALVATSLAILAAMRERGHRAGRRRRPLGRRVRGARGGRVARDRRRRSGSCASAGLAMAEAARQRPGAMAAILGLADEVVEKLCRRIVGVWPANYNCPGQIVVSGEHEAVEECCAEAAEPRRPTSRDRSRSRARSTARSSRALPTGSARRSTGSSSPSRVAPFMSTVTAKIEPAQRVARCSSTS